MNTRNFRIFYIKKAKGYRKIITYSDIYGEIREFHNDVKNIIASRFKTSVFSKAYIKKQSIITNVKAHKYNDIFISLDIKNFFQSINHNKLIERMYFEINRRQKYKITRVECKKIVDSCSMSKIGLAVGLIPSPILANIYLKEFDNIIYGKLKKMGLENVIYTRYADDMTISYKNKNDGLDNSINREIVNCTEKILKKYSLSLNYKKVRVIDLNISNHVRITGISISKTMDNSRFLTVGRKRKNELYHRTMKLMVSENRNIEEISSIKGLQSFILSVEGVSYQNIYSQIMQDEIKKLGYTTLKDLIDNLK